MGHRKHIIVNLSRQTLTAYEGSQIVYNFDCATGDRDNPTPRGIFSINRKHRDYVSRQFNRSMDYAMFFNQGIAIHESHVVTPMSYAKSFGLDYFGSHGCVRLSGSDAKKLFDWAPVGTMVEVQ